MSIDQMRAADDVDVRKLTRRDERLEAIDSMCIGIDRDDRAGFAEALAELDRLGAQAAAAVEDAKTRSDVTAVRDGGSGGVLGLGEALLGPFAQELVRRG